MSYRFHPDGDGDAVVGMTGAAIDNIWAGGASFMAHFNADSYGGGGFGRVIDKQGLSVHGWSLSVDAVGRLNFIHEHSTTPGEWVSATGSIALSGWHHVVVTYDKGSVANDPIFYIDGVLSATTEIQTPVGTADDDTGARPMIGNRLSYDRPFDGRLADMRAYSRIITAAEALTFHAANGRDSDIEGCLRRFRMQAVPNRGPLSPYVDSLDNTVANATSITLTVPAHADGDSLLMVVAAGGINNTTPPNISTPGGWTPVAHEDVAGSPATWPSVAVYSRTASSEPASYAVSDDQTAHPWGGCIINASEISLTVDVQDVGTGTTDSPISPTITPTENAFVLFVVVTDNFAVKPTIQHDFGSTDIAAIRHVLSANFTGQNGFVLGVGYEMWDASATGTRTWNASASEEWLALSIAFPFGDGREGLPVKEESVTQAHGQVWNRVVGDTDELEG